MMKKGCFFTFVFLFTIITASVFYIVKKYGSDIVNYGKEKVFDLAADEVLEKLNQSKTNIFADSLAAQFSVFISKNRTDTTEAGLNRKWEILKALSLTLEDEIIDSIDFNTIKKLIVKK